MIALTEVLKNEYKEETFNLKKRRRDYLGSGGIDHDCKYNTSFHFTALAGFIVYLDRVAFICLQSVLLVINPGAPETLGKEDFL